MTNMSAYVAYASLALTVLFTGLMWIPYTLALIHYGGLGAATGNRETQILLPAWADRAKRAHANAVENLVLFAPVILVAMAMGAEERGVAHAGLTYLGARVIHYFTYLAGVPYVRTLSFVTGLAAVFYMIFICLW